jgi:hypothetical protein
MIDREEFMQEIQLRKHIREAIKVVHQRRKGRLNEEEQLRKTIRQLITEADPAVATAAPHANTGINALEVQESLFDNSTEDLQETIDIDVGTPEDNPAFIDVEKKEVTPEEEVEDFTISGQDKTGRNRAYTDYKDIEKNLITAFDDLDDPRDRQMFKDYLLTNLKLYFERFEEELQTDLPAPDIQTPPDAQVVPSPAEAPPMGLQERLNLDMDEIVGWLLSNDTKK